MARGREILFFFFSSFSPRFPSFSPPWPTSKKCAPRSFFPLSLPSFFLQFSPDIQAKNRQMDIKWPGLFRSPPPWRLFSPSVSLVGTKQCSRRPFPFFFLSFPSLFFVAVEKDHSIPFSFFRRSSQSFPRANLIRNSFFFPSHLLSFLVFFSPRVLRAKVEEGVERAFPFSFPPFGFCSDVFGDRGTQRRRQVGRGSLFFFSYLPLLIRLSSKTTGQVTHFSSFFFPSSPSKFFFTERVQRVERLTRFFPFSLTPPPPYVCGS